MTEQFPKYPKPIRSYVLRQGRMTNAQQTALDQLWPLYGLTPKPEDIIDLNTLFKSSGEKICEIGFGMGQSLLQMAAENPKRCYVGIEVHPPGIGALLAGIHELQLTNIKLLRGDATELLKQHFRENTWDGFQLFFPDPWPKKRHHKRRLLQKPFIELLHQQLKTGGFLHIATDWEHYAVDILALLNEFPGLVNQAEHQTFLHHNNDRQETKFERRGKARGHGVWDLLFSRI